MQDIIIPLPQELKSAISKGYLKAQALVVFLFTEHGFANPTGKAFKDTALQDLTKDGRHIWSSLIDTEKGNLHLKFT
jgi:hypothetical protein